MPVLAGKEGGKDGEGKVDGLGIPTSEREGKVKKRRKDSTESYATTLHTQAVAGNRGAQTKRMGKGGRELPALRAATILTAKRRGERYRILGMPSHP